MTRVFVDTNIPLYAAGMPHPLREPAQRAITAIVSGKLEAVTDTEVFQEILYRYFRVGERAKAFQVFDSFQRIMLGRILPVDDVDTARARELLERYPPLDPRDAIHAAIALRHDAREVLTADRGFGAIDGLKRLALADFPLEG